MSHTTETAAQSNAQLTHDAAQQQLADTAKKWVAKQSPIERIRQLRDAVAADPDHPGFSKELWAEMGSMGWLGAHLPEDDGGLGLGFAELCIVLEAAGRQLMPEPFTSTLLLGGELIRALGNDEQRSWLPRIAAGEAFVAVAHDERHTRYDLDNIAATATRTENGYVLNGDKHQALDAHAADLLIVSAILEDEIALFFVAPMTPGVTITRQTRVDGRNAAIVTLADVTVDSKARLGTASNTFAALERVADRARIGLAAELIGIADEAFALTLAYLKERVQFAQPIGAFQALQHRASRMFVELTLARSAVVAAAAHADDAPDELAQYASLAKARAGETAILVAREGIQMHGGVGVTDEYDIGFYLKRARAADITLGDAAFHTRRWATLSGY